MYKKEIRYLIIEIFITIIIIIISFNIWNKICIMSRNNKQIAAMYTDTKLSVLNVDYYENKIVKLKDKESTSSSIIRVHNISSEKNNIKFLLQLPKDIEPIQNYLMIEINRKIYILYELIDSKDNNSYYIKLNQEVYNKYETKTFNVKIFFNNNYNIKDGYYNYDFIISDL